MPLMAGHSEQELITLVQGGDASAFGALYEKYADVVYAFVYWKVQHRETAEDITSRTFMKALKSIRSLEAADGAFRPWVYTIARNTVVDHWRTRHEHADIDDVWDLAGNEDIPRDADARLRLAGVQKYLHQLDAVQRDVVLLRVWGDLSYEEIGRIIGKRPDNCKVIFSRAVRKMRIDLAVLLAMALIRSYIQT
jgi:RNA polymerase sigma-70 factor (ECF subfamily)